MENTDAKELARVDYDAFIATREAIPKDTMDELGRDATSLVTWVKFNESGFIVDGNTFPELTGVIKHIYPHFACWTDPMNPVKTTTLATVSDPDSFERRCDIHIVTPIGLVVGISMPRTSYTAFCRYAVMLQTRNLNPVDVITGISVTRRKGREGFYSVLQFRLVDELTPVSEQPKADRIPF